jgi:hypothetical protein
MCRGSGEMAAYERPSGGNPSVAGCHSAILRLRVAFLGQKVAVSVRFHPKEAGSLSPA